MPTTRQRGIRWKHRISLCLAFPAERRSAPSHCMWYCQLISSWCSLISPFFFSIDKAITILFLRPVLCSHTHETNRPWVMRPSERITFWTGETYPLCDDLTLVRLGGHFLGSTVLHWAHAADSKGVLLTGDTIMVVPDWEWVSFMWSYPNLIPLPAAQVRRIADTIVLYDFERLYSSWDDRLILKDAHSAVQRSADRYIRALEGHLS